MLPNRIVVNQAATSSLTTHTVLRNTWLLLSLTLLFSAAMSVIGTINPPGVAGIVVTTIIGFVLLFVTQGLRNSPWGLVSIFAFTGCMGYSLGPLLNQIIHTLNNGTEIILFTLAGTGTTFLASSAWVVMGKKDLSTWGKTLMIGLVVCVFAGLANIFLKMPAIQLALSSMMVFISTALIMFDTSRIINNGETNYIMATIALYLDILVLFQNLLILLAELTGNRK